MTLRKECGIFSLESWSLGWTGLATVADRNVGLLLGLPPVSKEPAFFIPLISGEDSGTLELRECGWFLAADLSASGPMETAFPFFILSALQLYKS